MRKLLLPLILIAGAIFAVFWYIQPTYAEIQSIRSEIEEYDQTLAQVSRLQQVRDDLLSTYNSIESGELERLNKMMPDAVDTVRLLIELDEIAATHGMTIQDINFSRQLDDASGGPSNQYNTIEASFSVSGSYEDMLSFARDIEQSARLIDIQNLTVTAGETGTSNQYQFTLATYWFSNQ